jgi:hypothetical protein
LPLNGNFAPLLRVLIRINSRYHGACNDQLARNATSRGRLGRRLLGRSWRRFANGDRRGRDGAAHSRHLKPGSAVSVWRFGSGSGDGVHMPAVALPLPRPAHHYLHPRASALATHQPRGPIRHRSLSPMSLRHLGRIGLDLMTTSLCTTRSTDLCSGSGARRHRWVGLAPVQHASVADRVVPFALEPF